MLRVFATVALVGCLGSAALAEIDVPLTGDNTKIKFVGTKPNGKHEGGFGKITGSAKFEPTDSTSLKISVDIDMSSLTTDDAKLTKHLKSADFFNVPKYPKSRFVSSKVEKDGDGFKVTGDLTLNGKTKSVTFPAKITPSADGIELTSSFKIDRHDWGISFNKGKIDDAVSLTITISAKK